MASHLLPFRKLISLKGNESFPFLQALITKDLRTLNDTKNGVEFSYLLNARGRIVTDLLVYKKEDEYLLEVDTKIIDKMVKLLKIYKLRRDISISISDYNVGYSFNKIIDNVNKHIFIDPRVPTFGWRILNEDVPEIKDEEKNYHLRRMIFGIPEGSDETSDELPLNMNGDLMNGVNFDKGCYIGQELTARTNFIGVVRKRLLPLKFEKTSSQCDVDKNLYSENNKKRIGKLIKRIDNLGIGIVSIDQIDKEICYNDEKVLVLRPEWWKKT
uniref:GCV_T domain-containing protein n=1 Tax=Parastrongyloides trichosuri TaxID=131310 RepID=A0A0N5A1P0_PARTI